MLELAWLLLGCGFPADDPPEGSVGSGPHSACVTDGDQFAAAVSPVVHGDRIVCGVEGGAAGSSRNLLLPASDSRRLEANRAVPRPLALERVGEGGLLLLEVLGE